MTGIAKRKPISGNQQNKKNHVRQIHSKISITDAAHRHNSRDLL